MDLLTPLPVWMKDEMGWRPPEHTALLDGDKTTVRVTSGDEDSFRKRYGAHLGRKTEGGYTIKQGAWIKLVASLIHDGILPYAPQPVTKDHWDPHLKSKIVLRDYQPPFVEEFLAKGAVFWNLPPGGGKTFLALHVLNQFRGRVCLFAPSIILCEQWRARLHEFAPDADVTILTYASGKKSIDQEWDLVIFDEVQTLPADTFSKLAFLKTKYRIGLSASPWREDGRQYLIAALSGFPCAIRWADLIRAGVLKRPRILIVTLPTDAAKTRYVQNLLAQRRSGRALIFCDFLERGQAIANALGVPFVSGETANKFKRVQESEVCVVSRIADRGLDFPDLTLVVEVAFLGSSREQEAQRLGRLLHSEANGDHYLLFTPEEAAKFKPRIYGIETELAGEVELEFITVGSSQSEKAANPAPRRAPSPSKPQPPSPARKADPDKGEEPKDEINALLSLPAVAAKIAKAESMLEPTSAAWVRKIFRICHSAAFTPEEIVEGLGRTGSSTVARARAACRAMKALSLLTETPEGRHTLNHDELNRLRALTTALTR